MRQILYHLALWLFILAAGAGLFVAARGYAKRILIKGEVQSLVQAASRDLESGSDVDAQRKMERLLRRYPAYATEEIVTILGDRILGLPKILHALHESSLGPAGVPAERQRTLSATQVAVISMPPPEAAVLVDAFLDGNGANTSAHLWRGRIALSEGDFPLAKRHFDTFWRIRGASARREFERAVHESVSQLDITDPREKALTVSYALWWRGLLEEAIAHATDQLPPEDWQKKFFDAVQLDLSGAHEQAAQIYAAVLNALPNHHFAALRLIVIDPQGRLDKP
jgi:hypothetical protein